MNDERSLEAGERVLLIDAKERRYLITLATGKQFHSHNGSVEHDEMIGGPEGRTVRTTGGAELLVFRPTLSDYVMKMKRGAQIVYPKDVGLILVYADIFAGAFVIEAGTGSGALTLALARAVGDSGRVISYEVRDDHHERGSENVAAWYEGSGGKPENLELRVGDIFDGIPEKGADRMVLDMPEPWHAIGTATASLAAGGLLCCYLPTIPQVSQTVEAMRSGGFSLIDAFEGLLRTWNIEGQSVRPDHRMVGHTGFIVVGRKLAS
ncbi:MAG: tRNA (adenine57-N1/adenine58-N1)-methyltransferase catalytic subunit [Actinomycetota bacterium]|nr:tRNA (adenine57-N1/adenine58-N1)-methyltransferase catalytic subunit [Actinomycetota bacterium]